MRRLSILAAVACGLFAGELHGQGACQVNYALRFDGADDFVVVPHHASLNIDNVQPFTLEAWVRAPILAQPWPVGPAPIGSVVEKWNGQCATPYPYTLRVHTPGQPVGATFDGVSCSAASGVTFGPQGALSDGRWHHVAYVRDSSLAATLFVDGLPVVVSLVPPLQDTSNQVPVYIGRRGPGGPFTNYFAGDLDEVRVSSVARYAGVFRPAARHQPDAATRLLLHFDEGQGFTAQDSSGGLHHGLLGAAVGPVSATPAWIASTLPGDLGGLHSSVNGGPFDPAFKTFAANDTIAIGLQASCFPALAGTPATLLINIGLQAGLTGVTPPPFTGIPPIAGFHAVHAFSAPASSGCILLGDGLGLAAFGLGTPVGGGALHIGDPPFMLSFPPGVVPPGLAFRMQALFALPDAPALLLGVTNELLLQGS